MVPRKDFYEPKRGVALVFILNCSKLSIIVAVIAIIFTDGPKKGSV